MEYGLPWSTPLCLCHVLSVFILKIGNKQRMLMLDNFEVLKFTGNRLEILILWLQYYSDTFIWISWKE